MESICTDFWKMVHSRKCGVIVMTSDLQKEGLVNKISMSMIVGRKCVILTNRERLILTEMMMAK